MQRSIAAPRLAALIGSLDASGPAYLALADVVRLLIADGRVPPGVRLPSERELTGALGVSRTTVSRAYATLRDHGYLRSRQGSGSVAVLPDPGARRHGALRPARGGPETLDLTCAALAAAPGFQAAAEAAVSALPAHLAGIGYQPLGVPSLRAAIAERYCERGLPTNADQVMITSGALAGFAATARALLAAGDRILMESPTYPNAIETARRSGARPVALPLDPSGWDTSAVVAALRQTSPRAAYLVPDFHNPTGLLMSAEQRREIGRALQAAHTIPVVDETLADLAIDDPEGTPPPLAAYHPRTVSVGGASKTYWGGLRIGWIRAPRELLMTIADARLTLDLAAPVLEQLVMLELLPQQSAILRERRERLAVSRQALVDALRHQLPDWSFTVPSGGLSLWVELPEPRSTALTVAAERRGVVLAAGSQFAAEGSMERFIRLPYADHDPEVLTTAVAELARAWDDATTGQGPRQERTWLVA